MPRIETNQISQGMQRLTSRFIPNKLSWKRTALESSLLLVIYLVWLVFRAPQSPSRSFIGYLAILAPMATAFLLTAWSYPRLPKAFHRSRIFLAIALLFWLAGNLVRTYFQVIRSTALPTFSAADILILSAYPFLFLALFFSPAENRYIPSQFRFLLDVAMSSGVAAAFGWLIMARPALSVETDSIVNLLPLVYPVADLVLIFILINSLLANPHSRRIFSLWGISLVGILISDNIYSYQALVQGFRPGGADSLGWIIGGLLFCVSAVIEGTLPDSLPGKRSVFPDTGVRFQNMLPIILVLSLIWFVLADWQMRGQLSQFGFWTSLFLAIGLVVRLGVRAGEVELYKYWQLFSGLAEPIFICDGDGKVLLSNPAMSSILQEKPSQVNPPVLTSLLEGQGLTPDLLNRATKDAVSTEVVHRSTNIPYLLSLNPIYLGEKKILIAGVAYDIRIHKSQQKALQDAYVELQVVSKRLEELNSQLEQKVAERTSTLSDAYRQLEEQNKMLQAVDQLKSDFVSMVSHELRTPLTSLHGGLELLLARPDRKREDQSAMILLKNEVQRLTRFVENILNVSAMEAGRLVAHMEPVDLHLMVQDVVRTVRIKSGSERIQLQLPAEMPMLLADESFLHSVLSQLLDNALKYTSDGPIVVDAFQLKKKMRIRITDTGPGIPEEKESLLFKRFQRFDARDSQLVYGYGLGLYMSRQLLQAQKSDLLYEKPQQGGARFYFDLKVIT